MRKNYLLILLLLLLIPISVFADGEKNTTQVYDGEPVLAIGAETSATVPTIGASDDIVIDDQADLLTDDQEAKLRDEMSKLTEFGKVVFLTTDNNSGSATGYAQNFYSVKFSNNTDGVIFIIDMSNREIYFLSCGSLRNKLTNAKGRSITDNIYKYASRKEYYECASKAFSQAYTILTNGRIAEPMRFLSAFFVALTTSTFIGFAIAYLGFRLKRASLAEEMKNNKLSFAIRNFSAVKTGTHMVYSPVSESSGGSSGGGGGGGGGGFSGGGHSF